MRQLQPRRFPVSLHRPSACPKFFFFLNLGLNIWILLYPCIIVAHLLAKKHAEVVTIRAMGQTFHIPAPAAIIPPPPPAETIVATTTTITTTMVKPLAETETLPISPSDDQSLLNVCKEEDPTSPPLSSSSCSSNSPPSDHNTLGSAVTSCADKSDDYEDFLSKFGILNLPLHPSLERHSVTQIDSPDDTHVSEYSPLVDQIDPLLTNVAHGNSGKLDLLCASGLTLSQQLLMHVLPFLRCSSPSLASHIWLISKKKKQFFSTLELTI